MVSTYVDAGALAREVDQLQRAVHSVEGTCSRLGERADEAEQAHSELAGQVELLEEAADETKDAITDVADETTEVHRLLRNLTGRVHQVEYRMRAADGDTPADLDSLLGAAGHASKISTADQARARLLTDRQRQQHSGTIASHEQLQELQQHYLTTAISHSSTIAATPPTHPAHRRAAAAFATVRKQYTSLTRSLHEQQNACDTARGLLVTDDQRRHLAAPVITAGERAKAALRDSARATISTALERRKLLPAWFTTSLGYEAPARDTSTWLDAAADLLAYRATYGITDQIDALGTPSDETSAPASHQWRTDLDRRLHKARQLS